MNLTRDQERAVAGAVNRVVSSCPGSGKTRVIIAKMLDCIESVRGTPRRVGCLTYTNAAVHEIESRLLEIGAGEDADYCEVNTIHSFCLNNVIRPFYHFVDQLPDDFEVLSLDSDWFAVTTAELVRKHGLPLRAVEQFGNLQRGASGTFQIPDGMSAGAAAEYGALVAAAGFITFGDILWYAYRIIQERPFVARALSNRFAWLLVDEFQDTTELQVDILSAIHNVGHTKFFLVGDPNQSIFGFAGARPDLMDQIVGRIAAQADVSLSGNFRCSAKIIVLAERLCPRSPPMDAVGENAHYLSVPRYFHAASPQEAILGYFLPEVERLAIPFGETAVLAPWWITLFPLGRALRERGIPIIGPGARPYRRSLEFAQFAEAAAAYVVCKDADTAIAAQRALFFLILQIAGKPEWRIFRYEGKRSLCQVLKHAEEIRNGGANAIEWLGQFGKLAADALISDELLGEDDRAAVFESVNGMIAGINRTVRDPKNMGIEELGIFARPQECVSLITMHGAKGREFDAVAVIDFHDDKVPHFTANAAGVDEARRLTYVAATRARKLLMFFSDSSNLRNCPSRFLGPGEMDLLHV